MKSYNRTVLFLFVTGLIAIFIGATQKISGNPNFGYALWAGMVVQVFSVACFVYWNSSKLKEITKLF